ncbi:MAG: hypothetical protein KC549_14020 [Myxococcales bacterium]|nr:hypothetical protein [Myxococcales bacterium]
MRWLCALSVAALVGCGPAEEDDPVVTPDVDAAPGVDAFVPRPDAGRPATACDDVRLAAACPPGSNPVVLTEGCVAGAEFTQEDGTVTGFCAREGECIFACNFQDPCRCGVDRVTAEGVFCTDCREASACGDAVCDRGENPQTCAVDCGETCLADNERCIGNARQECEENGRWRTLDCRGDQLCQFGAVGNQIATVCQTRISAGGGDFPGFGALGVPITGNSVGIRFRERAVGGTGVRFVEEGARVLIQSAGRFGVADPVGGTPLQGTNIPVGRDFSASPARVASAGRWPQLSEFFDDTGRTVEQMVHDGASAQPGAVALSGDDRLMAAAFAVGRRGGPQEPVLGIWRAEDGKLDHLLRFVDEDVVQSQLPATAVALGLDGAAAVEARPGGIVIVWNVEQSRYAHLLQTEVGTVQQLVPSVAGDDLLVVGGDQGLELWELVPTPRRRWRLAGEAVRELAIAPDSTAIAVGTGGTRLLDAADGRELFPIATGGALDFDPRGGRLLVGDVIYTDAL